MLGVASSITSGKGQFFVLHVCKPVQFVMVAILLLRIIVHCRHVDVRTSPQSCFVFTLRTHPAVQPGTIAFNAPQVPAYLSFCGHLLFSKK